MASSVHAEYEDKMKKTVAAMLTEFKAIRAGRANPAVVDKLKVSYYGAETPITQVASVSVPEPRILVIQPWDPSTLKSIEKAILASDIGINPTNDGKVIRLAFPPLTEERRKDLIKQVQKYGEEAKIAVRNVRREAMDKYKADKKKAIITEDDLKDYEKSMQDITEKYCKDIDAECATKDKELLEV